MGNNGVLDIEGKFIIEYNEEKKIVTISTPGNNKIEIDDDARAIRLTDQHKNMIVMNSDGISISSGKDITIAARGNIKLESKGKVNVKAGNDTTIESLNISAKAQASLKMTGTASAELSASGQTTVKGGIVLIN